MQQTVQIHNPLITEMGMQVAIAFCNVMAVDSLDCPGIVATYDGLLDPVLNVVMHTQTTEALIDEKIAAVFKFYQSHQAEWRWIVGPLSTPKTLPEYLQKHNLVVYEKYPGMYFDLSNQLSKSFTGDLIVREASLSDQLHDWVKPIRESFQTNDKAEGYRQLNCAKSYGPGTSFRHYIGYYEDEVVTSGTLFIDKDVVMIQNVGTKPAFRNRGFGTALTLAMMQDAIAFGSKHCFLDSSDKGFNVYSNIGFKIYCMYQIYGPKLKINLSTMEVKK